MVSTGREKLIIDGPAGGLEAVLNERISDDGALASAGLCAVLCHPHPLHGGTMDNKVVTTLVRAYGQLGVPALRFNTRGTGASEGLHDNGIGEVDDLVAVANWMLKRFAGRRLMLAGFSFGSGVAGNGAHRIDDVAHLTLVAPPVGRYGFSDKTFFPCPWALVMGDQDELIPAEEVYRWADGIDPAPGLVRIPEATHFFHGHLITLRDQLAETIAAQLGAK